MRTSRLDYIRLSGNPCQRGSSGRAGVQSIDQNSQHRSTYFELASAAHLEQASLFALLPCYRLFHQRWSESPRTRFPTTPTAASRHRQRLFGRNHKTIGGRSRRSPSFSAESRLSHQTQAARRWQQTCHFRRAPLGCPAHLRPPKSRSAPSHRRWVPMLDDRAS
jgi:hypothetical protein